MLRMGLLVRVALSEAMRRQERGNPAAAARAEDEADDDGDRKDGLYPSSCQASVW